MKLHMEEDNFCSIATIFGLGPVPESPQSVT